tara:strand:- start:79 stop:351 length:273 start_codon:yes stop_codon:yes gene_type:complete
MAVTGRNKSRNYKKEYANYHSKPAQKKNRAGRNAARTIAKKNGAKVAGKDVAHRNGNPRDNRPKNLSTQPASRNRSFARTRTARKRNPYA